MSLLLSFKTLFYAPLLVRGRSASDALLSVEEKCIPENGRDDVIWSTAQICMRLKNTNFKNNFTFSRVVREHGTPVSALRTTEIFLQDTGGIFVLVLYE